jgi:polar amino acid transport system permease protein
MAFSWQVVASSLPRLLSGAGMTLSISLLAILLGIFVGIALALGMQSGWRPLRAFIRLYVSFVRGTPLFIQVLVVFYILPAIGLDLPRFQAGVLALSLNSGAYISEMIRGGLSAIRSGEVEAARALGMQRSLIWRRIILPQVFVLILPPLATEFTGLLKASSLLMVIGVVELTRTAQQIISVTFRPTEIWLTVGAMYFVMCFALGTLTRRLERATNVYRVR